MKYSYMLQCVLNLENTLSQSSISIHWGNRSNVPQTEWLKQQGSGSWKFKIMGLADLVFPKASLLDLQVAVFLLCPSMAFSLCTHVPRISPSSYEDMNPIGSGPHPYDFIQPDLPLPRP